MRRLASLVALGIALTAAPSHSLSAQERTLYQRLGGYDAIAAVTDDFVGRLVADPQLGQFFVGHSTDSKMRIRQLVVDNVCAATGGPCVYQGRNMKTAHAGLGITEAQWNLAVSHLVVTLNNFKVGEREQTDLAAVLTTLKPDIVESR